jgi:hypothetical protein
VVKCERCRRLPAEFIQIDDWRVPSDNWFASCGCGREGLYSIHLRGFWPDMPNHVNEKRWSTPARMERFLEIANAMDPEGHYRVSR